MSVREDPIGNIFARWDGLRPDLPAVGDRLAHRRDPALRPVRRHGRRARRARGDPRLASGPGSSRRGRSSSLMFTSEEPTRFGIGCLGSRALCRGARRPRRWPRCGTREGRDVRRGPPRGRVPGRARRGPARRRATYAAFVELHIEQGPLLERDGLPIGVVTAIAAPASLRVDAGRARGDTPGAVLMPGRRDALCAAAEVVLAVETAAPSRAAAPTPSPPPASAASTRARSTASPTG